MRHEEFVIIGILVIVLALLINLPFDNPILYNIKNILGLLFIIFLPGYSLVSLLFDKKSRTLETLEVIVLSIGLSITLVILNSMLLHFIRLEITPVNILNLVLAATFVLSLGNFLKTDSREKFRIENKNFFFLLILTLSVLTVVIYVSATSPSKEEFIEISWKISKIENLTNVSQVICKIDNCSISGITKIGDIDLAGEKLKAIIMDIKEAYKYEYFCIDANYNNIYCDEMEGPFKYNDSFLINGNGFNVVKVNENNLIIINYPKEVNVSSFRVGFVVKSYYRVTKNLNVSLFINEVLKDSKIINLHQKQETVEYFPVELQEKGQFRVRVAVLPITLSQRAYIDFWVRRN
jgi:hypothetical protein